MSAARRWRRKSEFYGSMDGASKYVRGDAIAGIIVTLVNIVGGLIVGIAQHDLTFADAARNYTLLAIGDGLVAQIPALVISVAAGVVVSRVASDQDIGGQLIGQLFNKPQSALHHGGHHWQHGTDSRACRILPSSFWRLLLLPLLTSCPTARRKRRLKNLKNQPLPRFRLKWKRQRGKTSCRSIRWVWKSAIA